MFKRWLYPELRGFRHRHNAATALARAHRSSKKAQALSGLVLTGLIDVFIGSDLLKWIGVAKGYEHWVQVGLLVALIVLGICLFPAYRRAIRAHLRLELLQLRRCPDCFYDLRATELPRCPECGLALSGVTPGDAETR